MTSLVYDSITKMKGGEIMYHEITSQARTVVSELLEQAKLRPGSLFVVGCSSSEMVGKRIGKGSSMEAALAAFQGIYPILQEQGIHNVLYNPNNNDLNLYWAKDCVIVTDMISEAPIHAKRPHAIMLKRIRRYFFRKGSTLPTPKKGRDFFSFCSLMLPPPAFPV